MINTRKNKFYKINVPRNHSPHLFIRGGEIEQQQQKKHKKKKSRFPQWLGSVVIIQRRDYYYHYFIIFLLLVVGVGCVLTVSIFFFIDELIKGSLQNVCFCIS